MHQTPDIALLITLTAAFIFILAGVAAYVHDRRRYRRDLNDRITALRIGKMLKHAEEVEALFEQVLWLVMSELPDLGR